MTHGDSWELISPPKAMQTHTAYTEPGFPHSWYSPLNRTHPVELYFIPEDLSGWPMGMVKVWRLDESNKLDLYSYGVFNFPRTSGFHQIECETWTPMGNWKTSAISIMTGTQPRLAAEHLGFNSLESDNREYINSQTNGTVVIELETVLRNFRKLGISTR